MTLSEGRSNLNLDPIRAREDYRNDFRDVKVAATILRAQFFDMLNTIAAERGGLLVKRFEDRYPADEFPGVVEAQGEAFVREINAIVDELNGLYAANTLTPEKADELVERADQIIKSMT